MHCSWVVCLDSDELFYTSQDSVIPHFEALAADGVDQMTYLNHEGVPEVLETPDYFATVTLFKRHHFEVPLSADARTGLRFWMDRSKRGQYLLFYDNGKSASLSIEMRGKLGRALQEQIRLTLCSNRKYCLIAQRKYADNSIVRLAYDATMSRSFWTPYLLQPPM